MKYYKFTINDIITLASIPVVLFGNIISGVEIFTFWHYIAVTFGYSGYLMVGIFSSAQRWNANKLGLSAELERINNISKKKGEITK